MKRITLVDGNHMLYRCAYMTHQLSNSTGIKTGGIYTFLQSLQFSSQSFNIVTVFDGGIAKFRKELFPEYKKRIPKENPTPDEISVHETIKAGFKFLPFILRSIGIPVIKLDGEEADDVIYVLANYFSLKGVEEIQVITEDDDYLQLVSEKVFISRPIKKDVINLQNFNEVIGIPPSHIPLKKALIGDSSDNIPGIRGIGEKTATKYLSMIKSPYPDLLFDVIKGFKGVKEQSILENKELISRNLELIDFSRAKIDMEKVIQEYRDAYGLAKPDPDKVIKLFDKFEITKLNKWVEFSKDKLRIRYESGTRRDDF